MNDECNNHDNDEVQEEEEEILMNPSNIDDTILDGYESDDVLRDNPYLQQPNHQEYPIPTSSDVDPQNWTDVLASSPGEDVGFSIDSATIFAWEKCISDVARIRKRLATLIFEGEIIEDGSILVDDLFDLAFGCESSEFGAIFTKELSLNEKMYLKFLGTVFLQMSYKEAPSRLFDEESHLKSSLLIEQKEFVKIWMAIARKGRIIPSAFVNESRREECFWIKCERACNNFLRDLSISGNNEDTAHSLDDDKKWLEQSGRNRDDNFGIMNTTHNRDNRKGIVAHTDVSEPLLLPLCFRFQRVGETAVDNFKAIFMHLYPGNGLGRGLPDLNGSHNHSDRGYTRYETVFKFLVPAGAEFTNTLMRVHPNPYVWGMKTSDNDRRTKLDEKGCPTLFVKSITYGSRKISVHAFRTGTKNISTVISSCIHGHKWEAIALNPKQRLLYSIDPEEGLKNFYFQKLSASPRLFFENEFEIKRLFDDLIEEEIDVMTLAQGTVDWHRGRQFSFTSSQSDDAIKKAIIVYQDDNDWCEVGQYLEGENYRQGEFLVVDQCFIIIYDPGANLLLT